MSFDLQIKNGDLAIGANGDFNKVEGTDKLVQDVLKLLLTRLGSNIFYPWYGSLISQSMIGQAFDFEMMSQFTSNHIQNALETLQKLQQKQAVEQRVTPFELIAAIKSVKISRNRTDLRFFTIEVQILTRALSVTNVSFDVRPTSTL